MSSSYNQDENQKQLIMAINNNVIPLSQDRKIKVTSFHKSRKLSNFFIKNEVHSRSEYINDHHHVVYQYSCNRVG